MKPFLTAVPGKSYFFDRHGRKVGLIMKDEDWMEEQERREKQERLHVQRRPADARAVWVSEDELPNYIPYSAKEIREMRKRGVIKPYPDLRPGGRRVTYNLLEVSAQIRAGRPNTPTTLLQFDPEGIQVTI